MRGRLDTSSIEGKWESALTTLIEHPFPNVEGALVNAGSDRRGAAYVRFDDNPGVRNLEGAVIRSHGRPKSGKTCGKSENKGLRRHHDLVRRSLSG
jgi:hypothetical protein